MIGLTVILGLIVLWVVVRKLKQPQHPLLPGPKPWPIIGNVLDMPTVRPWETYRLWCQKYSESVLASEMNLRNLECALNIDSDLIHIHLPTQPASTLPAYVLHLYVLF